MKILVVGSESNLGEFREKFIAGHEYHFYEHYSFEESLLKESDLVFDFHLGDNPEQFELYSGFQEILFVSCPKISLAELAYYQDGISCNLIGFNGLPGFLNRSLLEVSMLEQDIELLSKICGELETDYQLVDDRVGMVTPRVISMIINEAYYTLQEGTASVQDIDTAMKLGTNYPLGPFEWCERIGIENVYELLEAIYDDTKEERYKICPLLKKEYLKN